MRILLAIFFFFSSLAFAGPVYKEDPTPTAALEESRVLTPRALVTDTTGRYYLTLLSAPLDHSNPNPGTQYVHDDTSGTGSTIFIIDSGFNIADFPDEFCNDGGRWREDRILSRDLRSTPLTDDQLAQGVHFPPNTLADVGGIGEDNLIHGHGRHRLLSLLEAARVVWHLERTWSSSRQLRSRWTVTVTHTRATSLTSTRKP